MSHPSGPSLSSYGGTSSVSSTCSPSAQSIVRWLSPNPPKQEQFIVKACHDPMGHDRVISIMSCRLLPWVRSGRQGSLTAGLSSLSGPRQILTDPIKAAQKTCKANLEVFFAMTFVPSQVFLFKYRHSSRLLITLITQDTKKKSAVKVLS